MTPGALSRPHRRALLAAAAATPAWALGRRAGAQASSANSGAGPVALDAAWRRATAGYDAAAHGWRARLTDAATRGPFTPDWASLESWKAPAWYEDARFGVFVHWGVYAVPAFGSEWYPRNMYLPGTPEFAHHRATYGPQDRFGYKDFIPRFQAERFDPHAWAALFREAGARYVVPVAEHHDGFQMYDSSLSDWTAAKMGPRRDVLGELRQAIRAEGLRFCLSSHRAEHDWFFNGGRTFPSDVQDPRNAALYGPAQARVDSSADDSDLAADFTYVSQGWLDDWSARTMELAATYDPDLIYFDWWIGHAAFRNTLPPFLAAYYNLRAAKGEAGVVNYKLGEFAPGSGVLDIERGEAPTIQAKVWQTCTSISRKSWGYIEDDSYKTPQELIHTLIDVASKNGNLLLNVGPRADGTIPDGAQATFRAMGGWLKANGEAIYGSRPWRTFGEGPTATASGRFTEGDTPYTARDVRFTTRDGRLYAILLGWPEGGRAVIGSIRPSDAITSATLVADGRPVPVRQQDDGLHLNLPAAPVGDFAYLVRLERAGNNSNRT